MARNLLSNRNKLNLFLDLALVVIFVCESEMRFTGLRNHELFGLAFGLIILVHLVLHWRWIVTITKTFFRSLLHQSRLNYVLNLALFLDAATMVLTGIVISHTLGLNLGIDTHSGFPWERIHILSAELSLIIVALHVGIHWKWIATRAIRT